MALTFLRIWWKKPSEKTVTEITGSEDVAVVLEGYHSCVSARGIKKNNTRTMTVELRGSFKDDAALQMYLR